MDEKFSAIKQIEKEKPPKIFEKIGDFSVSSQADFQEKFRIMKKLAYFLMEQRMGDWLYDEELDDIKYIDQVLSHLKSIILSKNDSDNYFLKELAKTIYEKEGDIENLNQDIHKFEITKGIFSWYLGDTIRISSPEDYSYIEKLFFSREKFDNGEKGHKLKYGNEVIDNSTDLEYILQGYISNNLRLNDLIVSHKTSQDKADFKYFLLFSDEPIRNIIEKKFGIEMKNLSLPEQFRFLQYIKNHTVDEMKPVEKLIKMFGVSGARTFLSIEQGGKEMGDKIMELGDKLPQETAQKIFSKYGEIVDTANNTKETLKNLLPEKTIKTSQVKLQEIQESLLIRAKELLSTFYDKKEFTGEEIFKDLERYKTEILLYADIYKKLKQNNAPVSLESFKNTQITILSQEEKIKLADSLWDVTLANRKFIKDPQKIEKRKSDFYKTIENENSYFYVLRYKDNIVAFCSFTPDENGDLYAESLNVESEIRGAQIGSEFFPAVLEKIKNPEQDIYGYVHADNKATLLYYERIGFRVLETQKDNELKYEIRIPKFARKVA